MNGRCVIDNTYYRSLTKKMILIVILVSLTPLILVSGIILNEFQQSYSEKVIDHLSVLVDKHKVHIDNFLEIKLKEVRSLVETLGMDQLQNESFLEDQLSKLHKVYGIVFEDLGVINPEGLQVAYAGPYELLKAKYSDATWFNKAINKEFYISDVFLGLRGLPHFIVSVRVNHRGKPWLLRATIDFLKFNKVVENLRVGKTGLAFIVNREGYFQTQPPKNIVNKNFNMDLIKADKDKIQINESLNIKINQGIIYVSALLKNNDWIMVFRQERDDALSDFRKTQNVAILIIILGALVIMAMAVILSGISVNRIEEADREKEMMNQQMIETGKLASVGELAAGIAHEINNPVAIMVEEAGWMQDLLEEETIENSENGKEFARSLKQIQTQGQRCKEITHKLLSFARKTDSRIHDVQINELIKEVLELSGQRAKYASVNVTTNLENNLPMLRISQTEFQQVLLNLINNAVDAMEKTGGKIEISSYLEDDNIIITVSDTGPGIPKANLSRIFDPFFTTKPVGKGTGLGLSICYGIIKKLGGELKVHSLLKEGTVFKISIPLITEDSKDKQRKTKPKKLKNVGISDIWRAKQNIYDNSLPTDFRDYRKR